MFFFLLQVTIQNNDIELVGNIIQSIAEYFEITELQTIAQFPREIAELVDITEKVNSIIAKKSIHFSQ